MNGRKKELLEKKKRTGNKIKNVFSQRKDRHTCSEGRLPEYKMLSGINLCYMQYFLP